MRWLIYCRSYENRKYPIDPRVFSFSLSELIDGGVFGAGNMLYIRHLSIPPFNTRPILTTHLPLAVIQSQPIPNLARPSSH